MNDLSQVLLYDQRRYFMRTGIGLSFENGHETRKLGPLPYGKLFEAERERVKSLERTERVFKG